MIPYPLVGLDINEDKPSKITFGSAPHSSETWLEFDNQMKDRWAFNLSDLSYNNEKFLEESELDMKAVIDTKNGDI